MEIGPTIQFSSGPKMQPAKPAKAWGRPSPIVAMDIYASPTGASGFVRGFFIDESAL